MKINQILAISGLALLLVYCGTPKPGLQIVESQSFDEKQISLDESFVKKHLTESNDSSHFHNLSSRNLDELISLEKKVKDLKSDSCWFILKRKWEEFNQSGIQSDQDSSANSPEELQQWAGLNADLLKLTGEIRFADVLERLVYRSKPAMTKQFLISVIYTHLYDQIFVNLFSPSSLTHYHTTGGTIKLIQETVFPESNEITLKCETTDVRYLDVFIRIPEWAVNPKVLHGNVKYVAHPGEYCQISRKWNDGDIIQILLKN